jgi:hypothetical protein
MTESELLSRDIHVLKELQRLAWRELTSPNLTMFDRCEIRNRIKQSEFELRTVLRIRSERSRSQAQPADSAERGIAKPELRLLAI